MTIRIQRHLLEWYAIHARDLPWRRTRDPYAILVAEIMLQQTQVDRVIPRWQAWLEQFPAIRDLADASPAEAIRAWQGLGYNLRALRLHAIARQVVSEFDGQLPRSVEGLLALKGVGRYTAGAVASFAYEQPVAMVDTNVRRVLSRVFGVEPNTVETLADVVLPRHAPYPWNQALMDLGASLCRAKQPMCLLCPLVGDCGGPRLAVSPKKPAVEFRGSQRYYRGRIVEALRELPDRGFMTLDDLAARILPTERGRILALVEQLAVDGMLKLDADGLVRLPE